MAGRLATFIFGRRVETRLPERVRAAIAAQQIQAEALIGWVQLFLVSFFALLYAVAPKTSAGTDFMPVPWALGAYFLFTVLRLALTYRGRLPGWFLICSVLADMTLLMVLIWTFHLQYRQPAAFYLKAPTMLYVFIFISLRALRFEPGYVIAAGLAAAAGWLVLLAYALFTGDMGMDVITRDYVLYMTSNHILIGGEIDKIVSILLVTTVLAVALVRARRLLVRAMVDSTVAEDLSRFVSPEIAERITSADRAIQPGDGEVRVATVMFTDIEGFSTISEKLPPDRLAAMLNEYFGALAEVIARHGGTITQFQGDAMLIGYNTVKSDPGHAASAVRTAVGIQKLLSARTFLDGIALKTRCGLNTGEMVTGAVGSPKRLLFTVHGDEVNVAARLEQLNKQYGTYILAAENTVRACGAEFPFEPIGEITVRGRSRPTPVFALRV